MYRQQIAFLLFIDKGQKTLRSAGRESDYSGFQGTRELLMMYYLAVASKIKYRVPSGTPEPACFQRERT